MESADLDSSGLLTAEELVLSLGPLSSLYTASIRAVRSAPAILKTDSPERIQKFSVEAVGFPVKVSPTFKAAFYFYAEERDEAELAMSMPVNYLKLLGLFGHDELIAVLALTYIYRLLSRRCDLEEWNKLMPKLSVELQLGGLVGERVNGVGFGHGMFMGGIRCLAQAILLYRDIKGFKELRRKCEKEGTLFNCAAETERWGCNHLEVASMLVSALGYGVAPRLAFGVSTNSLGNGEMHAAAEEENGEIEAWRSVISTIESLHSNGSVPAGVKQLWLRNNAVYPDAQGVGELERNAVSVVATGSGFSWIHKSVSDLPDHIQNLLGIRSRERSQSGSTKVPATEDEPV